MMPAILQPATSDLDKTFRIMPHVQSFAHLESTIGQLAASRLVSEMREHMNGTDAAMSDAEVFDEVMLWYLRTGELEAFVRLHDDNDPWTRISSARTDICEGSEIIQ